MSDASVISLIVALCALCGAAITCAYDIARRRVDGATKAQVDMLIDRILSLEQSKASLTALDVHGKRLEELREDNKAEFSAMKTAFDRFTTRQAVESTINDARGVGQRQFG